MTAAPRKADPIATTRAYHLARGWFSEDGDPNVMGRFVLQEHRFTLPGQEPKIVQRIVLLAFPVNNQNLVEPDVSATPMKWTNHDDLLARFPEAWEAFLAANPNAPIPERPAEAMTPEQLLGPMPNTRTRIPWPGFTDDVTYGQLIQLNICYLEFLAYATDAQAMHVGSEGPALRQKARDMLGIAPVAAA